MAVRTERSSECPCLRVPRVESDARVGSVMSFVGYDYQKERARQPSEEWASITEEELPTGDDDF